MVQVEVRGSTYYMNEKMKHRWDNLKDGKLTKKDEDRVYIVDGRERSGKSVFTIQQAAYIDPTVLDDDEDGTPLPRICFSPEELINAIRHTKSTKTETRVIIFDEAFRGMSSKSVLSKTNKMLSTALQEMGQNNVVLFIVSPSFFMLEIYPAVLRSSALFHVQKDKKTGKRFVKSFNYKKKGLLYREGMRKGWNYKQITTMRDWFFNIYPGGDEFEARYRKKKLDSLKNITPEVSKEEKFKEYFKKVMWVLAFKHQTSIRKMAKDFEVVEIDYKTTTIKDILQECPKRIKDRLKPNGEGMVDDG